MPVQRSLNFAAFLGRCLWKHYKRGKIRAIDNLRASYPNETEQWYESVGKRSFEQVVMLVIDILYTPKLVRKDNWREFSHFTNTEYAKWIIHEHKGALMVTGHYGNFEIVGYMLGLFGFDINSVARPLDNPYMNDYLYGVRERHGQKILNKKGASNEFGDILQSGATLGFIGDQDAGSRGIFVDFFGRKASAYKSIAIAALYYNVPIIIGITRRVENRFFFEVELEQIIMPADWKDKDDPIRWVSQEYNSALERAIRKDPTQYWWLHRRWKTRPKNELAQE
jgi:KDO2-lipid IV(A) lauroyltransferase